MVSGRNFERGSSDGTNENATLVLTLISITRCPECGAQPGEPCRKLKTHRTSASGDGMKRKATYRR